MAVTKVKLINYKKLKNFEFDFNSRSALIIGESGVGKSTILEVIDSAFMRREYADNPLSEGEEKGMTQVEYTNKEGMTYTIERKFDKRGDKRLNRFKVTDHNGGDYTISNFLKKEFGQAFKSAHFDYETYFFKKTTPESRFEYMIKAIGGEDVLINNQLKKKKKEEREMTGGQRETQKRIWDQTGIIDESVLQERHAYFKDEKDFTEAKKIKQIFLDANLVNIDDLEIEYKRIVDHETARAAVTEALDLKKKKQAELELELAKIKEDIEALNGQLADLNKVDELIPDANITMTAEECLTKINEAKTANEKVNKDADDLYDEEVRNVNKFNTERDKFLDALDALDDYNRLNGEWEALDAEMTELDKKSREIFKSRLPIPTLTIETDKDGQEFIAWNGREFAYENLSKGETILVTTQILSKLNPKGDNVVLIPDANLLGSKIDEVFETCKECGVQAILEYTERDRELSIEFKEA